MLFSCLLSLSIALGHTTITQDTTIATEISDIVDHQDHGAGLYIDCASCTLLNCNFTHCATVSYETAQVEFNGGGIYVKSLAYIAILDCSFTSCSAAQGGAAWFEDGGVKVEINETSFGQCSCTGGMAGAIGFAAGNAEFQIHDCNFDECSCLDYNESKTDCAILYVTGGGVCFITGSTFSDTLTGNQVHMFLISGHSLLMIECTFQRNYGAAKIEVEVLCSWENVTYQNNDPSSVTISSTKAVMSFRYVRYENSGQLKVVTTDILNCENLSTNGDVVFEGSCLKQLVNCEFRASSSQIVCNAGLYTGLINVVFIECTANCLRCESELINYSRVVFDTCTSATSICEIAVISENTVPIGNLSFIACKITETTRSALKFTQMTTVTVVCTSLQFINCTSESNGGGLSVLDGDCASFFIGKSLFQGCQSRAHGGGLHSTVEEIWVVECRFERNEGTNGAGMYAKHAQTIIVMETDFYDCISTSKVGSASLEFSNTETAWLANCTFAFKYQDSVSNVVYTDGSIDCVTLVSGCDFTCLGTIPRNRSGIHFWSNGTGICRFQLPMSFDAAKYTSMYFYHGQDPAGSLDIFANDPDVSEPTLPPTKTKTPKSPTVAVTGDGAIHLTTAEIVGVWITIVIIGGFALGVVSFTYWRNAIIHEE